MIKTTKNDPKGRKGVKEAQHGQDPYKGIAQGAQVEFFEKCSKRPRLLSVKS